MNRRDRRAAGKRAGADLEGAGLRPEPAIRGAILGYMRSGRYLDAQLCCQKALEASPEHPELMHLMALVCLNAKQFDHAVEWASRAIRKEPKLAYLTTLGTTLLNLGRHDDALKVFEKAVQLNPDDPEPWWQMGNVLIQAGRWPEALLTRKHTLKLNPRHGEAAYQAGYYLNMQGRLEEALTYLDRSAELQPDHVPTLQMRALVLMNLNRLDESLAVNRRAAALDPANADLCSNIGSVLLAMGRTEEALAWYDRSLQIRPDSAGVFTNKAKALVELIRVDEAMALYDRAIALDPNCHEAVWQRASLQLLIGDFEAGWSGREMSRWGMPDLMARYPKFPQPMWLGQEPVAGKTLVVCQDQGLGDVIHFARYLPLLASRGAHVILLVDPPLCPLLSRLSGVSQCLPQLPDTRLPPFDFHVPIDSLPMIFGTRLDNIPAAESYLPPPDVDQMQAWESRLGPREKLRVGLVWSGNPKHSNDHNRSVPLRMFSELLKVDAKFVSLQKNPRPQDAEYLRERPDIVDFTSDLLDLAATAALISCLDLVITIDTSVAHLAAALGRPTWILLPQNPDFRWLLNRDDSPWYPTVRLFRQTETRDYGSVIERVGAELAAKIRQ
jgi:tetratricopeptide (TPR) repeat protein/ADP-heptose:LPS heptosyltransferase